MLRRIYSTTLATATTQRSDGGGKGKKKTK